MNRVDRILFGKVVNSLYEWSYLFGWPVNGKITNNRKTKLAFDSYSVFYIVKYKTMPREVYLSRNQKMNGHFEVKKFGIAQAHRYFDAFYDCRKTICI